MARTALTSFIADTRGATAIEYALIGTLVALAIFAGASLIGNGVQNLFTSGGAADVISEQTAKAN